MSIRATIDTGLKHAQGVLRAQGRLMMLTGLPGPSDAIHELAGIVWDAGAIELADRLERPLADEVKLLALTIDERRSS